MRILPTFPDIKCEKNDMNVQTAINAGHFVRFVYDNFDNSSKATNLDGKPVITPAGQPVVAGMNYSVLKTIYANDLATDKSPQQQDPDFVTMGIIAQNAADPTDIVIAIRGTVGIWEWLQDAKFGMRAFTNVPGAGCTEDGFTDMYDSFSLTTGVSAGFLKDVTATIPGNSKVTIVGHSLGSAIATLLALDMSANTTLPVVLYTLASPRVGDLSFHNIFNHMVPNAYRVANRLDAVPNTPPPLLYFHVGDDTELLPPSNMKLDLLCEHELTNYHAMLAALIGVGAQYPFECGCLKTA